jgi:hypothetical protein
VNTVTGALTNTGTTQGASTVNVVGTATGGTGGTVLVFAGTNDYGNTGSTAANIQSICDRIVANGGTPVVVAPAGNINGIGNNNAQDAAIAGARAGGYQVITPTQDMFVKEPSGAQYHLSNAGLQNIANQATSLTGQKVVMANGDSNALRAQQVLGVSGTATVGIGTGQILKDVSSNMPVIGTQVVQNNFYSSIDQPGVTWDSKTPPPKELGPPGTDHFSEFQGKWLAVSKDGQFLDKTGQSIGGSYTNAASLSLSGSTAASTPSVATTATPTADQIAADQKQFDNQFGSKSLDIGSQVKINGHTYTVGEYGTLTPATAPSTTAETTTPTRTLTDAPSNAEVGMPDNSTKSIKLADDGKTFQSATYTDPSTGLSKTIGADGTITLTGGGKTETVGNYFGNQAAITEPPTAQQAGLPNGTEVLSTYDTSGKLVGVTYVTPPPSLADLKAEFKTAESEYAKLHDQYTQLTNNGQAGTPESQALLDRQEPYLKQMDALSIQIKQGSESPGTSYTLNLQTGKLTNDSTGEVTGTVSTKTENAAETNQFDNLKTENQTTTWQQDKIQGLEDDKAILDYQVATKQISEADWRAQTSAIDAQINALTPSTPSTQEQVQVQVTDTNVSNETSIVTGEGTQSNNPLEINLGVGLWDKYNQTPNGVQDPTTRELGTPAATTAPNTISIDPSTGIITGRVSTNNPYYGLDGANSDPNSFGDTNKPTIIVDDPNLISSSELPGSVDGTNLVSIDANTGNMTGVVQTTNPNAYLDATVSGNQDVNMTVDNKVSYDPNTGLELGQQGPYTANMTMQNTNNPSEFYSQVDVMPSGGRGEGNTILESPGERASYQAPASTDSNGTTTPGGDSVGGTTDMSSPGGAAPSGSSAAAGGGGC